MLVAPNVQKNPRLLKILQKMLNIKDECPQFPVPLQNLIVCWLKEKPRSLKIIRKFA